MTKALCPFMLLCDRHIVSVLGCYYAHGTGFLFTSSVLDSHTLLVPGQHAHMMQTSYTQTLCLQFLLHPC